MQILVIIGGIILWILLFIIVYFGGIHIIESERRWSFRRWKKENRNYSEELKNFKFRVILFFITIPVLLIIKLLQELG